MCEYIQSEGGSQPGAIALSPIVCELCGSLITDCFIDGRTYPTGRWAKMCPTCHHEFGVGIGIGRGQRYCRRDAVGGDS